MPMATGRAQVLKPAPTHGARRAPHARRPCLASAARESSSAPPASAPLSGPRAGGAAPDRPGRPRAQAWATL